MNSAATAPFHAPARAFDRIAEEYDRVFTNSAIGRVQRDAVWEIAERTFSPGSHILELNCGTGEDAFFFSRLGMKVYACDASENMIEIARRRQLREAPHSAVEFNVLATESLSALDDLPMFDGVFSNFGGLNCVTNIAEVGRQLARRVRPGGKLLLCICSRFCLWEIAWFLCHSDVRRAFRRVRGKATAMLNGVAVSIHYPTVREICAALHPWFALHRVKSIGLVVPPSYLEQWAHNHRELLAMMSSIDRVASEWRVLRVLGDHVLLIMERTQA
jgi:ubiquinone/menaquinone biosynthesis C-methylase UbiE